MSVAKKIGPINDDQINAKIQRKFDSVFTDKNSKKVHISNEVGRKLSSSSNFDSNEIVMDKNNPNNKSGLTKSGVELELSFNDKTSLIPGDATKLNTLQKSSEEIGFSFDFDMDLVKGEDKTKLDVMSSEPPAFNNEIEDENEDENGFTLEDSDIGDVDYRHDATKKTELFSTGLISKLALEELSSEKMDKSSTSIDLMSSEEAKDNIESTIKDILRTDLQDSTSLDLSNIQSSITDIEDSDLDLGDNTPSAGFSLSGVSNHELDLEGKTSINKGKNRDIDFKTSVFAQSDATMDFDLSELTVSALKEESLEDEFDAATRIAILDFDEVLKPNQDLTSVKSIEIPNVKSIPVEESKIQNNFKEVPTSSTENFGLAGLNAEDSMRFQSTIRALREERDELLLKIKNSKGDSKELEQENLTLKANLDEAKIEISILRKRHMVEIEDLKYRVSLSEEKKAMADEKAKLAEMRKDKLEQKVRIDFNQVKQREKELESKLELLSMDVESQVQSREHKILELRRKIDALEFNMENASIKEQRSHDDKRKLEDRLNKIMKTLRHSIKNLEDDNDHIEDDSDHQKDKY